MSCTFLVTCLSRKIGSRVHVDARKTGLPRRELLGGAIWGDAMSALASARCSRRRGEYATINIRWEVWEGGRVTREGGEVVVVRGGGGASPPSPLSNPPPPPDNCDRDDAHRAVSVHHRDRAAVSPSIAPPPPSIAIAPPSRCPSRLRRPLISRRGTLSFGGEEEALQNDSGRSPRPPPPPRRQLRHPRGLRLLPHSQIPRRP